MVLIFLSLQHETTQEVLEKTWSKWKYQTTSKTCFRFFFLLLALIFGAQLTKCHFLIHFSLFRKLCIFSDWKFFCSSVSQNPLRTWTILKSIDFKSKNTTNATEDDVLEVTSIWERYTCCLHKKANDSPTYINLSSNHYKSLKSSLKLSLKGCLGILQVLKSKSKSDYEETLTKCGYEVKPLEQNNTTKRIQKIIWFNLSFSFNVKTNVSKIFCS